MMMYFRNLVYFHLKEAFNTVFGLLPDAIPKKQHPYSKDWGMHLVHLKKLLRKHKIYAKRSKCSFAQLKVEFLGHIISWEGVATDPQKIESMVNWPIPTIVKALRGFLWLTAYYRGFIKGYGAIILAMLDFSQPFIVETEACGKGIRSVLMQGGRPIGYLSQHKKGNENRAADALSRIEKGEQEDHCSAITTQVPLWVQEIQSSYEGNTLFQTVIQAKILKELFTLAGLSLDMSSAYHPQSDGQTERINQCLENYLGYTIPNLTIGPYLQNHHIEVEELIHERFNLRLLKDNLQPPTRQDSRRLHHSKLTIGPYLQNHHIEVEELIHERFKVLRLLKDNLHQAQQRMKLCADKRITEREFEVGDKVSKVTAI
ncbi:UNVERIFIED_CONTAM: Retrovirus-related Pol polyprotein from transposon [Sesamum calycinum]|uniref:Retrovirus-related Pol polyprotein from transposon n=1 Tax=Sesamum calycinum TaxID=2727403 RepID=A0AAW2LXD0_9LAMI